MLSLKSINSEDIRNDVIIKHKGIVLYINTLVHWKMMQGNLTNKDGTSEKWNFGNSNVSKEKNSVFDFTLSLSICGYNF